MTVEVFRSPVDAGTTVLPYVAAATIAILATTLALKPASRATKDCEAEQAL